MVFVEPACGEQDIVVTTSVRLMCLHVCIMCCACMRLSGYVLVITSIFTHEFQNNLAQLFSLRSKNALRNICSSRLKVKVTFECQMIKWP